MKLKNRIIVGFMMVILVPLLLFAAALFGISETQHRNAANSESAQRHPMILQFPIREAVRQESRS